MTEIEKRKMGAGGRKSRGIKKDRHTRIYKLATINNIRSKIIIPNVLNFKTTQINLNGWITINQDVEQSELDKHIFLLKRKIKSILTNFAILTGKYQKENIVIIDTGKLELSKNPYQFMSLDVVLYNKNNIYDKQEIKTRIISLIQNIINEIGNDEKFHFIKKVRCSNIYER